MHSPVIRSPQMHQGTPQLIKDPQKPRFDSPILKKKIEVESAVSLKCRSKMNMDKIPNSPITNTISNKKNFFNTVKFNQQTRNVRSDLNNNGALGDEEVNNNNNDTTEAEPQARVPATDKTPENDQSVAACQSPIAPEILGAKEKQVPAASHVEKLLVERLLIRKDLKLNSMQERIKQIEAEMDSIKATHAIVVQELQEEVRNKDQHISRLQDENNRLKSLPGLYILQLLLYLTFVPRKLFECVTYIPKSVFWRVYGFYSSVFICSADCSESVCFFLELQAIKLRFWVSDRLFKKDKKSPPPKKKYQFKSEVKKNQDNTKQIKRRNKRLKA